MAGAGMIRRRKRRICGPPGAGRVRAGEGGVHGLGVFQMVADTRVISGCEFRHGSICHGDFYSNFDSSSHPKR